MGRVKEDMEKNLPKTGDINERYNYEALENLEKGQARAPAMARPGAAGGAGLEVGGHQVLVGHHVLHRPPVIFLPQPVYTLQHGPHSQLSQRPAVPAPVLDGKPAVSQNSTVRTNPQLNLPYAL